MSSVSPFLSDEALLQRVERLRELQGTCALCPRRCGVDREREEGFCRQPAFPCVAVACPHGGEEPVLSGTGGAGTVFLAGCNMRCRFCQNHQISQRRPRDAWRWTVSALADCFLQLERRGCHNIEWVSPTQHLPALVEALRLARAAGLGLPLIYNSNGYERVTVLRLLEGIVDVYLPDAKYSRDDGAVRLSATPDYVAVNQRALREMWRQVGPLALDEAGLARRGLIIRHLVLPGHLASTSEVLRWIGENLGPRVSVSLMAQYQPAHLEAGAAAASVGSGAASAGSGAATGALRRPITRREYALALAALAAAGLDQGWVQDRASRRRFLPDFDRPDPFAEPPCP